MYNYTTKVCSKCGEEKPISEFGKRNKSPDGLQYQCKECRKEIHREYMREYRKKNKEYESVSRKTRKKIARTGDEVCAVCGKSGDDLQRHHPDIEQYPYLIIWLCPKCHSEEHMAERKGEQ